MKYLVVFTGCILLATTIRAQQVDEGKHLLSNNRLTSAQAFFEKLVQTDPKNADAIYWLGQTFLMQNDTLRTRELYEKGIASGHDQPIVQVGMGHLELLQGKKDQAIQRFDAAIANSKSRKKENPEILGAIGRANADGSASTGDPVYGIEKLNRAIELDPKNPEYYLNLGISYLKLGGEKGGDAYKAFNNALDINPNYAPAKYRLGKIFVSQNNVEKYIAYFNGAVESDPSYGPAYLELYNYYSLRDVNKAREYLEKYMSASDKDCNVDFFYGDYLFRAGKYQESLDKALAMQQGLCKDYPRLKVLLAYNYDRLGDSIQAKNNISAYISTASPDQVLKEDYLLAASVLKNTTGGEDAAIDYLKTALSRDTVPANRYMYMDTIAALYKKLEKWDDRLEWLQKSFATNPSPSNFDIYNLGDASLLANNYPMADSMFAIYKAKYPDQIYGYLGQAKAAIAKDKDTTTGEAIPAVMEYNAFLEKTDKEKNKSKIFQNYAYLVYVHANIQKDLEAAIVDLEGILAIDPENSYAKQTTAQIRKILDRSKQPEKATSKSTPANKSKKSNLKR